MLVPHVGLQASFTSKVCQANIAPEKYKVWVAAVKVSFQLAFVLEFFVASEALLKWQWKRWWVRGQW